MPFVQTGHVYHSLYTDGSSIYSLQTSASLSERYLPVGDREKLLGRVVRSVSFAISLVLIFNRITPFTQSC